MDAPQRMGDVGVLVWICNEPAEKRKDPLDHSVAGNIDLFEQTRFINELCAVLVNVHWFARGGDVFVGIPLRSLSRGACGSIYLFQAVAWFYR